MSAANTAGGIPGRGYSPEKGNLMAIDPISSSIQQTQGNTTAAASTPRADHKFAPTKSADDKSAAVNNKPYTVTLTGKALAKSLKLSGQTPAQIAVTMGLDVKTVDSYLGLSTKTASATPAPAPAAKQAATTTAATSQPYSAKEEAAEPAAEKAAETTQGKK